MSRRISAIGVSALTAAITIASAVTSAALAALSGCSGADPTPTVAILEVTPGAIDPADDLNDDVRIVVEYYDGDGDLGTGHAEVHDCRADELVSYLDIPPIASDEAVAEGVPIQGTMVLQVNDVGTVPEGSSASTTCGSLGVGAQSPDEAVFCVILVDVAGNESVGDCTDSVAVESAQ